LLLILGGLVVIALFAALIGPYFVNWNDYKSTFESEAEKILGQPVRVAGTARATVLPSPSLTFTDVQVGDTEGQPMMTVERFDVTIELMPLLQGQIHVISMKLQKPHVRIAVDDSGTVDWLIRSEASKALDPEKVALDNVEIVDGAASYIDARSGITLDLDNINAGVQATSLSGPWRIEGSYRDRSNDNVMQVQVTTGRRLADGTLRVKTDINPANAPLTASLEGIVSTGEAGISYGGTYSVSQVVPSTDESKPVSANGWRSEGTFNLTRDRLEVAKAILSQGPPDRPASLAGSLAIAFGKSARFTADVEARQLDLDRSLGKGPSEPINVGTAAESLVDWLAGLYVPPIPGRISFNVPAIVVGGAVIQEVGFEASPQASGWQIAGFHARLPGQSTLEADGTLSTGAHIGFGGRVRLAVAQPATFASWWRGHSDRGAGRLLAPFDLSGRARIEPGRIALEAMKATIGDTRLAGSFAWTGSSGSAKQRLLETDISATRIDFVQIKALAELLAGADLSDTKALADSYAIKLAADELAVADVLVHDISFDAGFVDGTLTVNALLIGDIGGARVSVTRGQVEDIFGSPRGQLVAHLNAATLGEVAGIVDRIAPGGALSQWLAKAAPALAPVAIDAKIEAPPADGSAAFRMTVHGSANASTFDAHVGVAGTPAAWRTGNAEVSLSLSSYDALNLARQTGWAAKDIATPGSARLDIAAKGVPASGLDASIKGNFAGIDLSAAGSLILAGDLPPKFTGTFKFGSANLDPIIKMTGLEIPGASPGIAVALDGKAAMLGPSVELQWDKGSVAGREIGGRVTLAEGPKGAPRFDGDLSLDSINLGWLTELSLGVDPLPTGDPAAPWPKASFADPVLGNLSGKITVATPRMTVKDGYDLTNAKLALTLDPGELQIDLASGGIAGGSADGGLSIHNVGGNVNLSGRFNLKGAGLEPFVWQRGGRSVATGTIDAAASFEATGRSPTGLVSALTGGGTLAIHNGEARYINPRAASLVIKAADLGQEFTDQALADLFASFVDAGTLPFGEAGGAFAIAAGTVRLKSLSIDADKTKTVGSAAVDLNQMTLDSDWTVVFDPGDNKVEGTVPQVGIVFRGPLAAPARIIDVLQFGSYLNIRQEQRLQEILSTQEAVRQEKERFNREKRKIREDQARVEREARDAQVARADAAGALDDFHARREADAEQRGAKELAAMKTAAAQSAKAAADQAAAAKAAADGAEAAASAKAAAARSGVETATKAVADARAAESAALKAVDEAAVAAKHAKSTSEDAVHEAEAAKNAADTAAADTAAKAAAASEAIAAAGKAADEKAAAEMAAKAAAGALAVASDAEKRAEGEAAAKDKSVEAAQSDADRAAVDARSANDAVTAAAADRQEAEKLLAGKTAAAKAADDAAVSAAGAKNAAEAGAKGARDHLAAANAALQEADAAAAAAEAAFAKAAKNASERTNAVAATSVEAKAAGDASETAKAEAAKAKQALAAASADEVRKSDAAKAAQATADNAKTAADAAGKSADDAAAALAAAKAAAAAVATDAEAKDKVAAPLVAAVADAERAFTVARDTAAAAAQRAVAAMAGAGAAAEEATKKRAEAARATADTTDSANAAADAAERAAADAAAKAGVAKADAATATADVAAKEAALKTAESLAATPNAARDDAREAADSAAAQVKPAEDAARAAGAEVTAKLAARKAAAEDARLALKAAVAAGEKVIEATAASANADANAKDLADRAAQVQAEQASAASVKTDADQAVAHTGETRDATVKKRDAAKLVAAQAAAESAAAEAVAKAAREKAAAASDAAAQALADRKAAEAKIADLAKASDQAAAKAAAGKTAAEQAAARLAAAEGQAKTAADALATAKAAVDQAVAADAVAEKGVVDKTAAAKAANDAAASAATAKAAADIDAKTAADRAKQTADAADAAKAAASDKAAAETAARQAAASATANRIAAEQALAAATATALDADSAARAASDAAAAKAAAAGAALAAADAAAKAAGELPPSKPLQLPAKAAEASAAPAGAVLDATPVSPAAPQPAAAPPQPRKRPPTVKVVPRGATNGPMVLVPQPVQ
jgi:uncharacterized protein involved in outer membrane biogenesis